MMRMVYIDIIALILILLSIIFGAKKGFVKSFFTVFGGALSLLFAVLLCSSATKFLQDKFGTVTTVAGWMEDILRKTFGEGLMDTTLGEATQNSFDGAGMAKWIVSLVLSAKGGSEIPNDVTLNQIITPTCSFYFVAALCVIGLFIIFSVIFSLIGELFTKLHAAKPIKATDSLLGGIFGLIRILVYFDLVFIILNALPFGFAKNIMLNVESSILCKAIYSINVFDLILSAVVNSNVVTVIKSLL